MTKNDIINELRSQIGADLIEHAWDWEILLTDGDRPKLDIYRGPALTNDIDGVAEDLSRYEQDSAGWPEAIEFTVWTYHNRTFNNKNKGTAIIRL